MLRFLFLLAVRTGFEPATFCVTGRYANRYTTGPQAADAAGLSVAALPQLVNHVTFAASLAVGGTSGLTVSS